LVDEDFNHDLVRGLLRRSPGTDLARVQDVGLRGATDDAVLARAGLEGRVVLTHDMATLIARAYERVQSGQSMPGVIGQGQITLDAVNVYWTNTNGGTVLKIPLGGRTPKTLASGQVAPDGIAVDSTSVYWIEEANASVQKVPLSGGAAIPLVTAQAGNLGLAVDDTNIYWTNELHVGTVMSAPKGGGAPLTLASGQAAPLALVVDNANVYWGAGGNVMQVAKP
jgi:hypothetical protein